MGKTALEKLGCDKIGRRLRENKADISVKSTEKKMKSEEKDELNIESEPTLNSPISTTS